MNEKIQTIKIYDPPMCCSSGVCGPSVDTSLTGFAGAIKQIAGLPGVQVQRYNLSQQPRAFVENNAVKALLDESRKDLPFIFINNELYCYGRYPTKEELLQALKIEADTTDTEQEAENNPCCSGKGCC
jgi:hypothetical protein